MRILALMVCLSAAVLAQRGRLVGTVTDPSGAVVPGAVVRVINLGTGLAWNTASSAQGDYRLELLPPGLYRVEAAASNFAPARADAVRLAVNATQRVDLTLALAEQRQQAEVRSSARLVESDTSELGAVIGEGFLSSLPLNGRDFLQLAQLAPGVMPSVDIPSSPSGPLNINGQRDLSNNILIDGIHVNAGGSAGGRISLSPGSDPAVGQAGSSLSLISVDGVAEFKVQTQLAPAEFGGFSGAVINVNSKTGGNQVHGSAYHYLRNSALDANNFFANANGLKKPPLRNNISGAAVGGPIRRERTFYFATFEGLRQRLGVSSNARVPSAAARARASATVRPLIELYPRPTGPDNPDGTAPYFAAASNLVGETTFSLRADHRLTSQDDVFARYSFADSLGVIRKFYLNFLTDNRTRMQSLALGHVRRFSAATLNEARFGFTRSANDTLGALDAFAGARPVELDAEGNALAPGILIFSLPFAVAHNPRFVQNNNLFTWTNNLTLLRGKHGLKLGFWARRVQGNINLRPLAGGVYFFDTVEDLLNNDPSFFFNQVAQTGFGVRFSNFAVYAQDDWQATRRLKLNFGLRWELNTVPREAHGRFSPITGLSNISAATLGAPGTPLYRGDHNNFAPRLGFAYQLTTDGRTALRGGIGVYYDLPTPNAFQPALGPPFKITNFLLGTKFGGTVRVPVPPSLLQTTITGKPPFGSANVYDPENFRTPYTYHYHLTVQREIDRRTLAQTSYVASLGRRLIRFRPLNLLEPATGRAPNANFSPGALQLIETTAGSNYHSWQAHVSRRLDGGLALMASYTLGHSLDDVSNVTGTSVVSSFTASNPNNLRAEYASSDFDVRHGFVTGVSYELPLRHRSLGGWSVHWISVVRSAPPYTPLLGRDVAGNADQNAANNQRPNLVADRPLYVDSSAPPFRVANAAAFATPAPGAYGNAGRNILRSRGAHQMDFAVRKTTALAEKVTLEFRGEFFNLFNHPNFASPAAASNHLLTAGREFGLSKQMANESAGGLLGALFSSGGPRAVQFGLRLAF